MPSYLIESFKGGKADYEDRGIPGSFKFGSGLDIRKDTDSLSCQHALIDEAAGILEDLPAFGANASDGNFYAFGEAGRIYKRTPNGGWSKVYTDSDGGIRGAAEWCDNNGVYYLYWTTLTKLHRKILPGAADWSDVDATGGFPKTDLDGVQWHTMKQAQGNLLVCNGNKVGQVGFDSSWTNQALQLIPGNLATAIVERGNTAIIGTQRKDNAARGWLFSWIATGLSWLSKVEVSTKGVNALIDTDLPLAQAGQNGGIYFSDMATGLNPLPIVSFYGGGQVNPDGVDKLDGVAYFGVFGSSPVDGNVTTGIYSYGKKKKNAPYCLNLDFPIACDQIGFVKVVGSDLLFSYTIGANSYIKKVDLIRYQPAIYQSLDLKAPATLDNAPMWNAVKLTTKDIPAGAAIEVWYRMDKSGGFTQALMDGDIPQLTESREGIFWLQSQGKICEVLLKLLPSSDKTVAPEGLRIEVFFNRDDM